MQIFLYPICFLLIKAWRCFNDRNQETLNGDATCSSLAAKGFRSVRPNLQEKKSPTQVILHTAVHCVILNDCSRVSQCAVSHACSVPSQPPVWGRLGISSLEYVSDSPVETKDLGPQEVSVMSRNNFKKYDARGEKQRSPKLSSAFIMLFSTLFSFYLRFIIYPQLISFHLIVLLLPTTPQSPTLCSILS